MPTWTALERKGLTGPETGDLELEKDIPPTYDPNGGACWMPDNRHVAILDLRTGVANLWAIPVFAGGADRQLTHFSADGIWGAAPTLPTAST